MIAKLIKIHGDVQGVSYRYFARTMAENLLLLGWAKNEDDGSVTVFIQGREKNILEMIDWCKTGSPMSTVTNVESREMPLINDLKGFEIK
jgi:acylphosphatase